MVKIRLKRTGRKNRDFFRISVMDIHEARDGKIIEHLGWYDPLVADDGKKISLDKDRAAYWLSVGAQATEGALPILRREGVKIPVKKKVERTWKSKKRGKSKRRIKRLVRKHVAKDAAKNAAKKQADAAPPEGAKV